MIRDIRKAVSPVAGLGTRFSPATNPRCKSEIELER